MARKIKFALEMKDGAKVRSNLEELRENFDLEKAVGYFLSGKLAEWLEDRYYEEEAEALDAIDKDAPDLREKLCAALGVPYEGGSELDVEALERLNEKKAVLRQKTGDESIIANADKTALTQEDLADLLDMDEPVIYLCGESFNIPARVKNKKYVGILGTPKISVKANSQEELDAKGIVFENVKLPWGEAETKDAAQACPQCGAKNAATAKFCNSCGTKMDGTAPTPAQTAPAPAPNDALKAEQKKMMDELFVNTFGKDKPKWLFVHYGFGDNQARSDISTGTKQLCAKVVCHDQYTPEDIVHICMEKDFSVGWALTYDSFCTGGKLGDHTIKYTDIRSVTQNKDSVVVSTDKVTLDTSRGTDNSNVMYNRNELEIFLKNAIRIANMFSGEKPKEEAVAPAKQALSKEPEPAWRYPKEQMKAMFASTFKANFEAYNVDPNATFLMVTELGYNSSEAASDLTEIQKSTATAMLCCGQYTEDDLIHLRVSDDMSYGWAFTRDSFCLMANGQGEIIPYESLSNTILVVKESEFGTVFEDKKVKRTVLCQDGLYPSNAQTTRDYIDFSSMGWMEATVPLRSFLFNMKNMFQKR